MGQTTDKFVADNSAFLGSLHVNGHKEGAVVGLSTLVVTNECNLGGKPHGKGFVVRGLQIDGASKAVLIEPNRRS